MRPSARKKIQREIKRSEAPCSKANNQRTTDAGAQAIDLGGTNREVATQADIDAPAEGHGERGRAGHAARYSANDGKADSATEIRKSLPEQSMTKDGGPTEARRGRWAEQKVVHALIGGD